MLSLCSIWVTSVTRYGVYFQLQLLKTTTFVCEDCIQAALEEWRSFSMESGALCVTVAGTLVMPLWFAANLDSIVQFVLSWVMRYLMGKDVCGWTTSFATAVKLESMIVLTVDLGTFLVVVQTTARMLGWCVQVSVRLSVAIVK